MKTGIELIADERSRQITGEGWTPEHDDEHSKGELAAAALSYAMMARMLQFGAGFEAASREAMFWWPWEEEWWKPSPSIARNLEKSAALAAAEIDRLARLMRKPANAKLTDSHPTKP